MKLIEIREGFWLDLSLIKLLKKIQDSPCYELLYDDNASAFITIDEGKEVEKSLRELRNQQNNHNQQQKRK